MGEYHKVTTSGDVGPAEAKRYRERRLVALCDVGGRFRAFEGVRTHQFAYLSGGVLAGNRVKCPVHGATFGVRSGEAKSLPAVEPVPKHEIKVEDGHVRVALNPKWAKVGGGRGRRRR